MNRRPTETSLLDEMRRGDPGALGRLFAVVYDKLPEIARTQRPRRPGSEALTTTALVQDAFIKLFGSESPDFNDRARFMAVAATAMRQILIGHARRNAAAKRGGGQAPASFEEVERALASESGFVTPKADALLALDRAVERLHQHSERQSHIVECRFFGGMSIEETATALAISPATVKRDWSMAQAWLHRELQRDLGMRGEDRAAAIAWSELEALWEMVHELPAEQRAALLASRRVDGALRQELDSLLDQVSAAEAFFDRFLSVVPEAGHAAAIDGLDAGAPVDALAPPDHDPLLGSTLGHYHIVERLGQGGMGVVYRALDLRLHRTVALKLLRAHTPHDPRAKERLLVEARAAAALDHPNICTIYEVGETPEMSAFIAMAFYPGRTLEQALEPGPLPVATALDYATQIARGLGAAHERGIIHRDVKPANIIVTADGMAKLLDFGIARLPDVDVSREGVTPGTIAYMSPEQVTSRALDRRTDLWSFGVLLYEMVSGERPFRGESAGAVLYAILQESPPPVSTVRHELSGHLDSVIARLLAKDRDLRYGNAEELIADLTEIREGRAPAKGVTHDSPSSEAMARASEREDDDAIMPQEPVPAKPRRRWGRRAWYGAAAVALGAAIVSWLLVLELARGGGQRSARVQDGALSPQRMAAMDLIAQARRDVLFRTDSGRRLARDLFKAAIAADSTYAAAHAGLALMGITPGDHNQQTLATAEESARTAIRLDSLLPEAHAALGRVLLYNFRFAEAEAHLIRAIELDGPQSQLREFLISLYVFMGRPRDVLEQAEQFERNNPGASNAIAELARGLLVTGRCDEALAQLDRLAHLRPPPARAGNIAAQCHALRNQWPQAIASMRRVAATNERALPYLGYMLARGRQSDSARTIRDTLLARRQRGEETAYGIAVVYAGLGDFDSAFRWLENAYRDHSLRPDIMEPVFEDLHRDPRFEKLREKLGTQKR